MDIKFQLFEMRHLFGHMQPIIMLIICLPDRLQYKEGELKSVKI